jgi:hypothetical protein
MINAIKFYYEKVLGNKKEYYFIDRPKREQKLPEVLSKQEIEKMIKATKNIKHKVNINAYNFIHSFSFHCKNTLHKIKSVKESIYLSLDLELKIRKYDKRNRNKIISRPKGKSSLG